MKKLLLACYILTLIALLLWWRWPMRGAFGRHPLRSVQGAAPQAQPVESAPVDPAQEPSNAPSPAPKQP